MLPSVGQRTRTHKFNVWMVAGDGEIFAVIGETQGVYCCSIGVFQSRNTVGVETGRTLCWRTRAQVAIGPGLSD